MPKTTKDTSDKKNVNLNSNIKPKKAVSSKKKVTSVDKKNSKTVKKSASSKTTKKTSPKSNNRKKVSNNVNKKHTDKVNILEYYDLPYRYNKTIIKILYQTPKTLFVYWEISDKDRKNYIKQYGEDFFENTKPVLIIHNITMNYTFEIEINDFANCWYFNINDEKCEYLVELGRRPKGNNNYNIPISNNYLFITSSNKIESPNGHILFEKKQNVLFYKNVKTNETFSKNIANLEFIKYFGKIYNIFDMYKKMYKEDEISDINNPTSFGQLK